MELLISVVGDHEVEGRRLRTRGHRGRQESAPRDGYGANFPHVIRGVRAITPAEIPVSVAIGDFPNLPGMAALAAAGAASCGVQYVKVGLLGPRTHDEALALLSAVCRAGRDQDPQVRIMAAAYADAREIGSLPPVELPAVAAEAGADGCMIDTALKGDGTLLTELRAAELEELRSALSRRAGLLCALAGSLRIADMERLRELAPDIVGFRGAACRDGRRDGDRRSRGGAAAQGPGRATLTPSVLPASSSSVSRSGRSPSMIHRSKVGSAASSPARRAVDARGRRPALRPSSRRAARGGPAGPRSSPCRGDLSGAPAGARPPARSARLRLSRR